MDWEPLEPAWGPAWVAEIGWPWQITLMLSELKIGPGRMLYNGFALPDLEDAASGIEV
jgi:hypothetical protein